jgi:molybdopterin-guanine dinucleotide biosynthesis protein A
LSLPHSCTTGIEAEGFVLAGGRSTRMGSDKSLIQFAGAPLIQHALSILSDADLKSRIAGARADLSAFAPVIPDNSAHSDLGPLSGICSALNATHVRHAIFLPVDLPLIPPSLISYLLHHAIITESAISLVSLAGFQQTFPAVIDCAAVPALQASLQSNDRKTLSAFKAASNAVARPFSALPLELLVQSGQVVHPAGIHPASWFLNVNTPQDLTRAEALLLTTNRVI